MDKKTFLGLSKFEIEKMGISLTIGFNIFVFFMHYFLNIEVSQLGYIVGFLLNIFSMFSLWGLKENGNKMFR